MIPSAAPGATPAVAAARNLSHFLIKILLPASTADFCTQKSAVLLSSCALPQSSSRAVWPGSWVYVIRRFDRVGREGRLHVEDFAQLAGATRDTKYASSLEQVVKLVETHCSFPAVEKAALARRLLFCFLIYHHPGKTAIWKSCKTATAEFSDFRPKFSTASPHERPWKADGDTSEHSANEMRKWQTIGIPHSFPTNKKGAFRLRKSLKTKMVGRAGFEPA